MKTLIALVRHGVTDWNWAGRGQGHSDIPLNAEGLRQADAAAARLAGERWDAIYSSPLSRALHTAERIGARTGLAVVPDPRLKERNLGRSEGMTIWERKARFGADWKATDDAESDAELGARAIAALTEVADRHPGGRVICVAHGGLIAVFLRAIGDAAHAAHTRNTSITRVWCDGEQFTADGAPDYSHILVDGVEYSAEKSRVRPRLLTALLGSSTTEADMDRLVERADAVECAWTGEHLAGFVAASVDPQRRSGQIHCAVTAAGFDHLLDTLRARLADRFPGIPFA